MNYNWIDAATPQGRERLKELLDKGIRVVGKVGQYGRITAFWKHEDGAYDVDCYLPEPFFLERNLSDVEFLDPDQDSQIEALKSENEQLVKICQDNAGNEIVDKVLFDRQNAERQPEPLTIDQMREYCIKWCEGLGLEIEEAAYPCNKLWVKRSSLECWEIRYVNDGGHHNLICRLSEFIGEYATAITYSTIRAIERREIGNHE